MFQTLLVPLDGSEFSERSVPLARGLARASSGALHLVQVHPPAVAGHMLSSSQFAYRSLDLEAYAERHREEAGRHLEQLANKLSGDGTAVHTTVLEGPIAETLADHAGAIGADLIVMTTHGRAGANRMWLGSVADALVRHTHTPILLMHPEDQDRDTVEVDRLKHILVPLDGSDLAESVLAPTATLARTTGARLTLAHIVASQSALGAGLVPLLPDDIVRIREQANEYLENTADRLRSEGLTVDTHVCEGETAAPTVAAVAKDLKADLVSLATHGYGGLKRAVLGSVADKVLRSSPLPMLVLRPDSRSGS
ncbi:MAG: universal stress protein [Gemmatimonadota bacterium]|nr:universal stress protein [Gemmatimonadota bacterium]